MLGLVAASLGFSSLPEPVCVCGNFPLYMTENEAGSMGHSMCIFGRTMWMPMGGTMPGMSGPFDCPADMADYRPDGMDCAGYMDMSCGDDTMGMGDHMGHGMDSDTGDGGGSMDMGDQDDGGAGAVYQYPGR